MRYNISIQSSWVKKGTKLFRIIRRASKLRCMISIIQILLSLRSKSKGQTKNLLQHRLSKILFPIIRISLKTKSTWSFFRTMNRKWPLNQLSTKKTKAKLTATKTIAIKLEILILTTIITLSRILLSKMIVTIIPITIIIQLTVIITTTTNLTSNSTLAITPTAITNITLNNSKRQTENKIVINKWIRESTIHKLLLKILILSKLPQKQKIILTSLIIIS